jgi:hypothetical protein
VYVTGEEQAAKTPPSRLHSKVRLPGGVTSSEPETVKVADVLLVGLAGPLTTVVSGGVPSAAGA